jgi:putative ubiquitin-RnfH superfamily antitoxin RatB of RatAB toxin-antitoxin module
MADGFSVTVVYATPGGAQEVRVRAATGATLAEVVRASGILERCPEIDPGLAKIGVWGKLSDPGSAARADDRIEIYRPLLADPKTTRSARVDKKRRLAGNSGRK